MITTLLLIYIHIEEHTKNRFHIVKEVQKNPDDRRQKFTCFLCFFFSFFIETFVMI